MSIIRSIDLYNWCITHTVYSKISLGAVREREYESDETEETYNQSDVSKQAKTNRTKKAIKWTFQEK